MSLKERRMLEQLEGETLLSKPRWFVKDTQSLTEVEALEVEAKVEETQKK
jgi:hypothetical protein